VIKDNYTPFNEYIYNTRRYLKKAQRNAYIRKISTDDINYDIYNVYIKAVRRYRKGYRIYPFKVYSSEELLKKISVYVKHHDIADVWGIYINAKIVAYAIILKYGNTEAFLDTIVYDPEFLKYNISYLLYHKLSEIYLKSEGFKYINEGFTNLLHKTKVHEFIIKHFQFKKSYTNLNIIYRPAIEFLLMPIARYLSFIDPRLEALYKQHLIYKSCKDV
jgi:hypothetical protein